VLSQVLTAYEKFRNEIKRFEGQNNNSNLSEGYRGKSNEKTLLLPFLNGRFKNQWRTRRMKTLRKTLAVTAVLAMLIVSSLMVLVQAQAAQGELGKDLASDIRELVQTHKSDIKDFILEAKVDGAETEEELEIVNEYVAALKAKIEEVKALRDEWFAKLEAGEITGQEFAMEMKGLGLQIAEVAKTMGTIGGELGALGQSMASEIRNRVAAQISELQGLAGEVGEVGLSIAEEMTGKDLPVPELPELPEIPELPDIPQIPDVPGPPAVP
jgi:hypothetical protein